MAEAIVSDGTTMIRFAGKHLQKLLLLMFAGFLVGGCATTAHMPASLLPRLQQGESVAVAQIYEESSGDLTLLGNHLRDRVEAALAARGIVVKARKDLVSIIDDAEIDGALAEETIWEQAGADILVRGVYSLERRKKEKIVAVKVLLKAFRQDSVTLIDSEELQLRMGAAKVAGLLRKTGNIFQKRFKTVVGPQSAGPPPLQAGLNKSSRCYRPGEAATINVTSEPGVYLYIFSLSCDGNVAALYPGPYGNNEPLTAAEFRFPPAENSRIRAIRLQSATPGEVCRESFKLVAARERLDFSYLPFPENKIFTGVNGRDIEKISAALHNTDGFRQLLLEYRIDDECP